MSNTNTQDGLTYTSLHHIDYENNQIKRIDLDSQNQTIKDYISKLVDVIDKKKSTRLFEFKSNTCEALAGVEQIAKKAALPTREYRVIDYFGVFKCQSFHFHPATNKLDG